MASRRYVLDTNIIVSALLMKTSVPRQVFDQINEDHVILQSNATWRELESVLSREKFDRYITRAERDVFLATFKADARFIEVKTRIARCRDPKDDRYLELAVDGGAEAIITGDNDLLAPHPFARIAILKPADFLYSPPSR